MNKNFPRVLSAVAFVLLGAGEPAGAALLSRSSGEAVYDTVLDITWTAQANLPASHSFGVAGINATGKMTWAKAAEWIAAMNGAAHLGASDWRLPTILDTGDLGCFDPVYSGTDCGWNVLTRNDSTVFSELAHLYYQGLGNSAYYDTDGNPTDCPILAPFCLQSTGPFAGIQTTTDYWSSTEFGTSAFSFSFNSGRQSTNKKTKDAYVWAVRSGDIATLSATAPLPGMAWVIGGAFALLGWRARRR